MKKNIMILIFILSMPFLVSARDLNDLTEKWTEVTPEGYYTYPSYYTQLLPKDYFKNKILKDSKGFLVINITDDMSDKTQNSIRRFDRKEKIINELLYSSSVEYIELKDYIIVSGFKEDNKYHISKLDYNLNEKSSIVLNITTPVDFFYENNKFVFVETYQKDSIYYINAHVYDENLKELYSSSIITKYVVSKVIEKNYKDIYSNYYYIDENYKIRAASENDNGYIDIIGKNMIEKYSIDGTLQKTKEFTSDYSINGANYTKYNNYYYIGIKEYLYDSTTKDYKIRATYYKLDTDFNEIKSNTLTAENESYVLSNSIYLNFYQTNNILYTSFQSKYYKVDENLNFTNVTETEARGETSTSSTTITDPVMEKAVEVLNPILTEKKNYLTEKYGEESSVSITPVFEYIEYNNEVAIVITWISTYKQENTSYYLSSSDLIITSGDTYNSYELIKEHNTSYYTIIDEKQYYSYGTQITVAEENLIVAIGNNEERFLRIYSKDGKMIKELINGKNDLLFPTYLDYENGSLISIFNKQIKDSLADIDTGYSIFDAKTSLFESEISIPDSKAMLFTKNINAEISYFETPFEVTTKTDGKGTIKVNKTKAESGEVIEYEITPEKGYVLGVVKVIDSNGNTITFTSNKFTMPSSDVVIDVTFVPDNPDTTTMGIFIISCLLIIGTGIILSIKNLKQINWLKN